MNLNDNPTMDELRALLRPCDDHAGHHVLWVECTGEVHITPIPGEEANGFDKDHPNAKLWLREFASGENCVGPGAAEDIGWVEDLFYALTHEWPKAREQVEPLAVMDW